MYQCLCNTPNILRYSMTFAPNLSISYYYYTAIYLFVYHSVYLFLLTIPLIHQIIRQLIHQLSSTSYAYLCKTPCIPWLPNPDQHLPKISHVDFHILQRPPSPDTCTANVQAIQWNEEETCRSFFDPLETRLSRLVAVFSRRTSLSAERRAWLRGIRQLIFRDKFIDGRYSRPDAASDVSKAAITRSPGEWFHQPRGQPSLPSNLYELH